MRQKKVVESSQVEGKTVKVKKFNILITGDNNYNNVRKMSIKLDQIINSIQYDKQLGTFGGKYGAQLLGQIYAEQNGYVFHSLDGSMYKKTKKSGPQLYHITLSIGVKWSDLVLIFSNVYTNKIKEIIKLCQKNDKSYFLIKE